MLATIYFILFAAVCVASGLALLISRHPLNGAMALVVNMLSLGGLYAVLGSPFMGVVQILVYAGAVMMLVVFVIMVLNGARDTRLPRCDRFGIIALPIALGVALMLAGAVVASPVAVHGSAARGTVAATAARLFDTSAGGPGYFILFEVVGLILLSAMAAAVLLSKRKLDTLENDSSSCHGGH
jgi:NADH-quinone oxidoreductase subunit J